MIGTILNDGVAKQGGHCLSSSYFVPSFAQGTYPDTDGWTERERERPREKERDRERLREAERERKRKRENEKERERKREKKRE